MEVTLKKKRNNDLWFVEIFGKREKNHNNSNNLALALLFALNEKFGFLTAIFILLCTTDTSKICTYSDYLGEAQTVLKPKFISASL